MKKYQELAEADKLRREKQLKDLSEKGYFILDDGSKSTNNIS